MDDTPLRDRLSVVGGTQFFNHRNDGGACLHDVGAQKLARLRRITILHSANYRPMLGSGSSLTISPCAPEPKIALDLR